MDGKDRLLLLAEYFYQSVNIVQMYVCEIILIGAFSTETLSLEVFFTMEETRDLTNTTIVETIYALSGAQYSFVEKG